MLAIAATLGPSLAAWAAQAQDALPCPDVADTTLGWDMAGLDGAETVFATCRPNRGTGLSYPTRILGDVTDGQGSVLVAFTDPPELLGDESRILGAINVRDGQVVRRVDDWDASGFDAELHAGLRVPAEQCPADLKEGTVGSSATPAVTEASQALQQAFAVGHAAAAVALLAPHATCEDMALRTEVQGRVAVEGTPVHDGRLLSDEDRTALVLAALEPRS